MDGLLGKYVNYIFASRVLCDTVDLDNTSEMLELVSWLMFCLPRLEIRATSPCIHQQMAPEGSTGLYWYMIG